MAIQQAMGMPKGRAKAHAYLKGFVEEMKASGFCRRCAEAQQPARCGGRAEGVTRRTSSRDLSFVMPGLEPGIHLFSCKVALVAKKTWMAGSSAAMPRNYSAPEALLLAAERGAELPPPLYCAL